MDSEAQVSKMTEYVCECKGMQCKSDDPTSRWCDFGNCNTNWVPIVESEPIDETCSKKEPLADPVKSPNHYCKGGYELAPILYVWGLTHRRASAVEYIMRAGDKDAGKEIEDLRKAIRNIEMEIEYMEKYGKVKG